MKTIFLFSFLFCAIAMPALAELTEADLNKIRLIVNESEARVIEKVDGKIKDSENRMKEHTNIKNEGVQKQITILTYVVCGLIALIVAAIAIPQIIMAWRSARETSPRENIKALVEEVMGEITPEEKRIFEETMREQKQQIENLTQEIETLKQQRTVNP